MNSKIIRNSLNNIEILVNDDNSVVNTSLDKVIICGYGYGDPIAKFVYYLALYKRFGDVVEYLPLSEVIGIKDKSNVIVLVSSELKEKIENKLTDCIFIESKETNPLNFFVTIAIKTIMIINQVTDKQIIENVSMIAKSTKNITNILDEVDKVVETSKKCRDFDFIADGPQGAIVEFSRMILAREYGRTSMMENSEDFHHINIFHRYMNDIYTIVIGSSTSNSYSRIYETVKVVDSIGREVFVITDKDIDYQISGNLFKTNEDDYILSSFKDLYLTVYLSCKLAEKDN